jgi:hypothetical protein
MKGDVALVFAVLTSCRRILHRPSPPRHGGGRATPATRRVESVISDVLPCAGLTERFGWPYGQNTRRMASRAMMAIRMKTEHNWALAYVTGLVNRELLLQNEYFAAENRILRAHSVGDTRLRETACPVLIYNLLNVVRRATLCHVGILGGLGHAAQDGFVGRFTSEPGHAPRRAYRERPVALRRIAPDARAGNIERRGAIGYRSVNEHEARRGVSLGT